MAQKNLTGVSGQFSVRSLYTQVVVTDSVLLEYLLAEYTDRRHALRGALDCQWIRAPVAARRFGKGAPPTRQPSVSTVNQRGRPGHSFPNTGFFKSKGIFFKCLFLRERERQRVSRGGRGRHRIRSRLQALRCRHRARRGAPTHEL